MIVGPHWIWLHFPKCGGSSAEALLKKNFDGDSSVTFDTIDPANVIWHENIPMRRSRLPDFSAEGKRIVVVFRRLPDWMLSRVHFEAARPPHHVVSREQLCHGMFYALNGAINTAESVFANYNNPTVDTWIKIEAIHKGFEDFFGRTLKPIEMCLNENKFGYIRDHKFWFTKAELEGLYHAAPNWAAVEEYVYGDLLA